MTRQSGPPLSGQEKRAGLWAAQPTAGQGPQRLVNPIGRPQSWSIAGSTNELSIVLISALRGTARGRSGIPRMGHNGGTVGTMSPDGSVRATSRQSGSVGQVNASERDRQCVKIICAECNRLPDADWRRWRACRSDDPELDEPPVLAFFCPTCAQREFDAA
jgi:hypothetical protein